MDIEIARSCRNIIHVDNPPINIFAADDDDQERNKSNKRRRERSKTILLNYLETECREEYYKLKTWDELCVEIKSASGENSTMEKIVKHPLESEVSPLRQLKFDDVDEEASCCSIF